jgi:hypothetical protein
MHPLFKKADELSHLAIGAAIEVQADYHCPEQTGRRKGFKQKEAKATKVLPQYICGYIKVRQKGRTIRACEEFFLRPISDPLLAEARRADWECV